MAKIRKDIYIALTTRGRTDCQKTLQRLHPDVLKHVSLFCHPGELKEHIKNWGGKVKEIEEYDESATDMGKIREYLAWNAPKDKIIFLDDNLYFSVRQEGYKTPRVLNDKNFNAEEIKQHQIIMFNWLWDVLDDESIAISGISFRPFNRTEMEDFELNKRFFGIWGLNVKKYYRQRKKPIWMIDWPIKEDFIAGIAIRRLGYNIILSNKYAFDKTNGSNSKGGCSTYRKLDMQNEQSLRLLNMFPDFIKLKKRNNKNWGGEFKDKESLDVIIHWNKINKL